MSEADRLKLLRGGEPVDASMVSLNQVGKPQHPIRKRAWHRALKRGALWAIVPYEHMKNGVARLNIGPNRFARVLTDKLCPDGVAYICWPMETNE